MSLLRSLSTRGGSDVEARSIGYPNGLSFTDYMRLLLDRQGAGVSKNSVAEPTVAMMHPTVYRSVSKISGIVAQMPWDSFRGTAEVTPQPAVLASPSPGALRPAVWKRTAATSMLLGGGVYGLVVEQPRGLSINLINPSRVDWTDVDGWLLDGKPVDEWPVGPLWQVPYQTLAGSPKGINPLEYARRTTYAGMAAAEFGSNFFRDGGHPTAVLAMESDPGPEAARELKQRVMESTSGTNRTPLVIPRSVTWTPLQINPDDSQFIELMKFSGAELAGFFGLMPEHVGLPVEGSSVQYSNRENRQQDLLQDAIMPVLLPLEEGLSDLVPNDQRVKFNVAGLLRGDLNSRYNSYEAAARIEQMVGEPLLTVNEMRELEDRAPHSDDADSAVEGASARELAEIVQKIYLGVGVVVTSDEAREIVNKAGGNLPPGFVPDSATAVEAARSAPPVEDRQQSFAFNFPEQRFNIAVPEQAPPIVNVEPPTVNVDAPVVNLPEQRIDMSGVTLTPTPVTIENVVNVDPTPVNVNATAAAPTVNVQLPERKSRHKVKRDRDGRITEVVED